MGDIMKGYKNIIWGLLFIIVGIIVFTNSFGITNITIFFDGWWTLFIIIPCFIGLIKDDDKTGNLIGLLIGIVLLLCCQNVLSFALAGKLIIPVALVLIGLSFIFKNTLNSALRKEISKLSKNTDKSYCATFGGQNLNLANEDFEISNNSEEEPKLPDEELDDDLYEDEFDDLEEEMEDNFEEDMEGDEE